MAVRRAIIHLDMDAFYASVEQRDRPELRGKPLIVGGDARRGVVLAASYEVRPFGVRSAMAMSEALRLAPHAEVVAPRPAAYSAASEAVFAILESVTPLCEPLSLDEAFLDVTASQELFGAPAAIARHLRARIATELQLPASAGIAPVKFAAKIASDLAKPDGQREISTDGVKAFLAPLPIGRLWGVGKKTEAALRPLGLVTVGDIARRDPEWLERRVAGGRHLWELANGIDDRPVVPDRDQTSIGAEDTFEDDRPRHELAPHIHGQAIRVARRLRRSGARARVIQLKLKLADFSLLTRRSTLPVPTDDGQTIYRAALSLLERTELGQLVRLTGVSAQELVVQGPQRELFAPPPSKTDQLNAALDRITDKFGSSSIAPADVTTRESDLEGDLVRLATLPGRDRSRGPDR